MKFPFLTPDIRLPFVAAVLASSMISVSSASAAPDAPAPGLYLEHLHDFDFLVGRWQVHHWRLKERLAGNHEWVEFDGTCAMQPLINGRANVDENFLDLPGDPYRAVGLRAYNPKTGQWAIWWIDGRDPHADIDPPVKGHFENGVGIFETRATFRDKPVIMRFTWSKITPVSAHWEQAFSPDDGKTWEVNWRMDFQRQP